MRTAEKIQMAQVLVNAAEVVLTGSGGSNFPDWYTIDDDGIDSLITFLRKEFEGKTVLITVTPEDEVNTDG